MSLINEALKRAKQAPVRAAAPAASDPLLQPAMHPPPAHGALIRWLPFAALFVLMLSFWFLFLWWRQSGSTRAAALASGAPTNSLVAAMREATTAVAVVSSNRTRTDADLEPARLSEALPNAPRGEESPAAQTQAVPSEPATGAKLPENAPSAALAGSGTNQAPASTEEPEIAASDLKLQGIFYRKSKACAIIDGQTLFVGDEIQGAKIAGIERNTVRLERGSKRLVLTLR